MNRPLPPGDRGCGGRNPGRQSGHSRIVPRAHRLVDGVAAAAGEPTVGPCCATFGPRSLRQRSLGMSAEASLTWAGRKSRPEAAKARRGSAGRARKEAVDVTD